MANDLMNGYTKLAVVQRELKAPKGNYNSFGKYSYRSAEDILEALKPVLAGVKATVVLSDELVQVGDRYYIKASAMFLDLEKSEVVVKVTAYAREAVEKKGMDESQITGTASSYARKYALNGLFMIDDTKDADTDEYAEQTKMVCSVCGKRMSEKWYNQSIERHGKAYCSAECMRKDEERGTEDEHDIDKR